ncbi:MAG: DUF6541 family protein [Chloroflexia bacterium]
MQTSADISLISRQNATNTGTLGQPAILAVMGALIFLLVWAGFTLFGGVDFHDITQSINNGDPGKLKTPILAQSFVSTHDNLSRVELRITAPAINTLPDDMKAWLGKGEGPDNLSLDGSTIGTAKIVDDGSGTYLSVTFPPIEHSGGVTYTFMLLTSGYSVNSVISPMWSTIDSLSSGAMYTEDGAQAGDLAITTYYRYNLITLLGDTWNAITTRLPTILVFLLLLLLPGLALLLWFPNRLNPGQRLLAAPALSALILPVILLLASLIHFPIGPNKLWAFLLICAIAIAIYLVLTMRQNKQYAVRSTQLLRYPSMLFWIAFALIMLFTIMTRLASLRDLQAGVGMDAYHHTMITALFIRDSGILTGYEPYAPLSSFTYHFGFHTLSAVIGWLTGNTQPSDLMTLVPQVGQIAGSVLPIPALTLFGWRILGNRWVGLVAGAHAGVISIVPSYYAEWSRYTQGLGLAVLPVAWVLFLEVVGGWKSKGVGSQKSEVRSQSGRFAASWLTTSGMSWETFVGRVILAVLASAGLFLTHYRIAVLYAGFAALYVIWRAIMDPPEGGPRGLSVRFSRFLRYASRAALVGVLSLALILPWLLNFFSNFVKNIVDRTDVDVYYALAERLGGSVLSHYSLPVLAVLSACGIFIVGLRSSFRCMTIGFFAGILNIAFALYVWLNHNPIKIEDDLQYLFLGLSPVTWFLVLEIIALVALVLLAKDPNAENRDNREAFVLLPAITWLLLALWSSPQLFPFRLPGVGIGYLDAVTLVSGAWLPACLLAAYALVSAWKWWTQDEGWRLSDDRPPMTVYPDPAFLLRFMSSVLPLLVLAAGLALAPINERQPYVSSADKTALVWMRDNLPADSFVLANSFNFSWTPDQPLGSDSGLWIPLVANLRSSVTPINAYNEQLADPGYFIRARELATLRTQPTSEIDWPALKTQGITYVYVGSRAAMVGGFSVPDLLKDPRVQLVFHLDSVWLFKIL